MEEWIADCNCNLFITRKTTEQFCLQVANLLMNNLTKKVMNFLILRTWSGSEGI